MKGPKYDLDGRGLLVYICSRAGGSCVVERQRAEEAVPKNEIYAVPRIRLEGMGIMEE